VADAPPIPEHHGVHRTDGTGILRQFMKMTDDHLLAGIGDVEPIEAEPLGGREQIRQRRRRQSRAV
jgi:hypothetical protein